MSTFSKGDKVRCIQTWTTYVIDRGSEYTVEDVRPDNKTDTMEALVNGQWVPFSYFEKVAPEWVVGQQVTGTDYARLPVGSKAAFAGVGSGITKVGEHEWHDSHGCPMFDVTDYTRTLTHLPDATEPEDKDDLYVEPEPLKEGDWCLVWGQVDKVESPAGSFVSIGRSGERRYFAANAIVRPDAGQVPPWVSDERQAITDITKTLRSEGGMDYDAARKTAASLYRAGVRITEGGTS